MEASSDLDEYGTLTHSAIIPLVCDSKVTSLKEHLLAGSLNERNIQHVARTLDSALARGEFLCLQVVLFIASLGFMPLSNRLMIGDDQNGRQRAFASLFDRYKYRRHFVKCYTVEIKELRRVVLPLKYQCARVAKKFSETSTTPPPPLPSELVEYMSDPNEYIAPFEVITETYADMTM
jgi:hypothetical protein